jgi:hypothetical protein
VVVTFRRQKSVTIFSLQSALFCCSRMVQSSVRRPRNRPSKCIATQLRDGKCNESAVAINATIDVVSTRLIQRARINPCSRLLALSRVSPHDIRVCHFIRSRFLDGAAPALGRRHPRNNIVQIPETASTLLASGVILVSSPRHPGGLRFWHAVYGMTQSIGRGTEALAPETKSVSAVALGDDFMT